MNCPLPSLFCFFSFTLDFAGSSPFIILALRAAKIEVKDKIEWSEQNGRSKKTKMVIGIGIAQ